MIRVGWGAPLSVFLAAALLLGVQAFGRDAPPDDDHAHYLNVARSLAEGRGFTVDVVQFYLRPVETLPAPSNDYWMPLTSIVIAPFLAVRDRYAAAMIPVVLWSALAAALVCVFATRLLGSPALGAACGLAFACHPVVRFYGTTSDSSVLFAALVLGVFLLYADLGADREATWRAVLLGVAVGLAALTRADGLVSLTLGLLAAVAIARWRGLLAPTRRQLLLAAAGLALVLLPWSIRCLLAFGSPWPPSGGRALLAGRYAELFSREHPPSWPAFASRVAGDPLLLVRRAVAVTAGFARTYALYLGSWIGAGLTVVGTGLLLWRRGPGRALALAAVTQLLALGAVYAVAAGGLGVSGRNWPAVLPLILCAAAAPVAAVIERAAPSERFAGVLRVVVLTVVAGWAVVILGQQTVLGHRPPGASATPREDYAVIERFLVEGNAPARMPVITLRPHVLHWITRRPALAVPSDGIPATLRLARAFETKLVLLHNPADLADPAFAELGAVYGGRRHRAFDLVLIRGGMKLYRVHPSRAEADPGRE